MANRESFQRAKAQNKGLEVESTPTRYRGQRSGESQGLGETAPPIKGLPHKHELEPQNMLGLVVWACKPSTWGLKQAGFVGQPAYHN